MDTVWGVFALRDGTETYLVVTRAGSFYRWTNPSSAHLWFKGLLGFAELLIEDWIMTCPGRTVWAEAGHVELAWPRGFDTVTQAVV